MGNQMFCGLPNCGQCQMNFALEGKGAWDFLGEDFKKCRPLATLEMKFSNRGILPIHLVQIILIDKGLANPG